MASIIPALFGACPDIVGSLFGFFGIPLLPGMVPEVMKGAALGAADYGKDWFKTLGKFFENLFDLNFF
jgi:hypothetical protein